MQTRFMGISHGSSSSTSLFRSIFGDGRCPGPEPKALSARCTGVQSQHPCPASWKSILEKLTKTFCLGCLNMRHSYFDSEGDRHFTHTLLKLNCFSLHIYIYKMQLFCEIEWYYWGTKTTIPSAQLNYNNKLNLVGM